MNRRVLSGDTRRVLVAQALRAFAYGFGAVLLGSVLEHLGFGSLTTGLVLGAVVAGTVLASLLVARFGDRWGRRRCYVALYVALAVTGAVFAEARSAWLLAAVALGGVLSTDVVESGPFTSLEQAMLASELSGRERLQGFGIYNAVATAAGSLGALAAALPSVFRHLWSGAPADQLWFWLFAPVALAGAAVASSLSSSAEARPMSESGPKGTSSGRLTESRGLVVRLAGLFAIDSFGGGLVVQAFIAYWLIRRFGASTGTVGLVFFALGMLQTASFVVAIKLGERFGLLRTMVFTHLPSNVLLVALAFSPTLPVAVGLLLARVALSQMDVPARQAYVMGLVAPEERTAAAAYTNTARYLSRPAGPIVGGALASGAISSPFVVAGALKGAYDLMLWVWFRAIPLPESPPLDEEETGP